MKIEIKKYTEYKDSGVEWLGEIPSHWESERLASILDNVAERNRTDLPLLSITRGVTTFEWTKKLRDLSINFKS